MNNTLQLPFEVNFITESSYDLLKTGVSLPMKNSTGLFICTGGTVDASIGNINYHVKKNDSITFLPTGYIHLHQVSKDFKGMVLHSNTDFFMREANAIMDVKTQLYMMNHLQMSLTDDEAANIIKMMNSIHQRIELESANDISDARRNILTKLIKCLAETLGLEIINIFVSRHDLKEPELDHNDEVLRKFIISLNEHFRTERSVGFYAAQQYLSYGYFSKIVRDKSGLSAKEWIVRYVINDAKEKLEHTRMSVKEIADNLGFPNQSFFGKYFKQYVGVPPKDYRLMAAKGRDGALGVTV